MRGRAASGGRAPRRPCRPSLMPNCPRAHAVAASSARCYWGPSSSNTTSGAPGRTQNEDSAAGAPRLLTALGPMTKAHLPARPHHLLRGPGQRTTRGLTPGAQAAVEGAKREKRDQLTSPRPVGRVVTRAMERREAVEKVPALLRGGTPPHPHRRARRARRRRPHSRTRIYKPTWNNALRGCPSPPRGCRRSSNASSSSTPSVSRRL